MKFPRVALSDRPVILSVDPIRAGITLADLLNSVLSEVVALTAPDLALHNQTLTEDRLVDWSKFSVLTFFPISSRGQCRSHTTVILGALESESGMLSLGRIYACLLL